VVDQLRLAQNLMLILNTDAYVKVEASKNGSEILVWVEVEGAQDHPWLNLLKNRPKKLTTIHALDFHDENEKIEKGRGEIKFLSGGSVMSQGIVRLATSRSENAMGNMQRFICLAGFPRPIVSVTNREDDPFCQKEKGREFEDKLTSYTMREIKDLIQVQVPSNNTEQKSDDKEKKKA
jgi:hypothetical protein